jgi:hypothetical protein
MMSRSGAFVARVRTALRCSIILLGATTACHEVMVPAGGGSAASSQLVITPGQVRLAAVGDTARLRAGLYDPNGTLVAGSTIAWTSLDPNVFTIDQSGVVTGRQAMAIGRAVASADGQADTAYVIVADPDASPCLGYAPPVALAVGQAISVSMSDGACITSAGGGDEYIVVPWHGTPYGDHTVSLEVTGNGLSSLTSSPSRMPLESRSLQRGFGVVTPITTAIHRDVAFDRSIRELARRELMPLAKRSRAALARRAASPVLTTSVPTYLTAGDLVQLNTNDTACTGFSFRTGRVAATSARAIVVADTTNPIGGFSDADYARIAAGYDTLVAAVEDAAFGTPSDIDANGKVVIFFTSAVNALTAPGASVFVPGFFHPRDLLPQTDAFGEPFCPASNEREMFYMPVPDPNGTVNGNPWSVGFIDSLTIRTLAHENQHLVNFGRRLYVNDAVVDEEPWLNEGLSDIAVELVFYHAAGLSPRQNIGAEHFGTEPFDGLFNTYMAPSFADLGAFLQDPQTYSPYSSANDPGTRGAVWAFLRYVADHRGTGDGDIWLQLTNSQVSGFDNLFNVLGANLPQMLSAWSVSLYTDDDVAGIDSAYTQPSWNFRTAFTALPSAPQPYPLLSAVHDLADGISQMVLLHGGSSAFLRFSIASGGSAAIRVTSGGLMPPAAVQATIVRTR